MKEIQVEHVLSKPLSANLTKAAAKKKTHEGLPGLTWVMKTDQKDSIHVSNLAWP